MRTIGSIMRFVACRRTTALVLAGMGVACMASLSGCMFAAGAAAGVGAGYVAGHEAGEDGD